LVSQSATVQGVLSSPALASQSLASQFLASQCELALLRLLGAAPGAELQADAPLAAAQPAERALRLLASLRELEPEMAVKIQTLLISGRDGQGVGSAPVNAALAMESPGTAGLAAAAVPAATIDWGESGVQLVDYLRRGHAIACAMNIDVDSPLASWRPPASPDLDDRAWLSFGKQLASSSPADWQGFGVPGSPAQGLSKLYLKRGGSAWWSFQTVLDRPTPGGVAKERRALAKRRTKGVPVQTLDTLVGQLRGAHGRALLRASRAIRARMGGLGPSSRATG
jgi:hypothetical protein